MCFCCRVNLVPGKCHKRLIFFPPYFLFVVIAAVVSRFLAVGQERICFECCGDDKSSKVQKYLFKSSFGSFCLINNIKLPCSFYKQVKGSGELGAGRVIYFVRRLKRFAFILNYQQKVVCAFFATSHRPEPPINLVGHTVAVAAFITTATLNPHAKRSLFLLLPLPHSTCFIMTRGVFQHIFAH